MVFALAEKYKQVDVV